MSGSVRAATSSFRERVGGASGDTSPAPWPEIAARVWHRRLRMAAVLCLVLLPMVMAFGFMLGALRGELSMVSVLAGLTFLALGGWLLRNVFAMARQWDSSGEH